VKWYYNVTKSFDRLSKRDLGQDNLTLGQLLDTHFPMSGSGSGSNRVSRSRHESIPLTLHIIWTDTEEDYYPDFSLLPASLGEPVEENQSPTSLATASTSRDRHVSISSDGIQTPERQSDTPEATEPLLEVGGSDFQPESESELPTFHHVISRKVGQFQSSTAYYEP